MANISIEATENNEFDTHYTIIKEIYNVNKIEESIKLAKENLERARTQKNKEWIAKFDEIHSKIKREYLESKINFALKRAKEEEEVSFNYPKAISFYTEAKTFYDEMYALGKDYLKIKKEIARLVKKLKELEGKQKPHNLDVDRFFYDTSPTIPSAVEPQEVENIPNIKPKEDSLDGDFKDAVPPKKWFSDKSKPLNRNTWIPPPNPNEEISEEDIPEEIPIPKKAGPPKRMNGSNGSSLRAPPTNTKVIKERQNSDVPIIPKSKIDKGEQLKPPTTTNVPKTVMPPVSEHLAKPHLDDLITDFIDDKDTGNAQNISIEKLIESEPKISKTRKERDNAHAERIPLEVKEEMLKKIMEDLKEQEYTLIPKSALQISGIEDIDLIAVSIIQIHETKDLILILPIRICDLKGSIVLGNASIDYKPENSITKLNPAAKNILIGSNFKLLNRVNAIFLENIVQKKNLHSFLQNYLKLDLEMEKSRNKQIFFHSGLVQYKILVDPLLVCYSEPVCSDKTVLYPYQKENNIHAVSHKNIPGFLKYLEKKNYFLEDHLGKKNEIELYYELVQKFSTQLGLYSVPFIGYAFAFIMIVAYQQYFLFSTFLGLGYANIGLYGALASYLYSKFNKEKQRILTQVKMPHYKRVIELDTAELMLIHEELGDDIMEQFLFETSRSNLDKFHTEKLEEKPRPKKEIRFESNTLHSAIPSKFSKYLED